MFSINDHWVRSMLWEDGSQLIFRFSISLPISRKLSSSFRKAGLGDWGSLTKSLPAAGLILSPWCTARSNLWGKWLHNPVPVLLYNSFNYCILLLVLFKKKNHPGPTLSLPPNQEHLFSQSFRFYKLLCHIHYFTVSSHSRFSEWQCKGVKVLDQGQKSLSKGAMVGTQASRLHTYSSVHSTCFPGTWR